MTEARAVTLLVLRCRNVDIAREFYESIGVRMVPEQHGVGPQHYSATLGGIVLELYPLGDLDTRGLRIGLRVSDVSAAANGARRSGGRVLKFDAHASPLVALVEDPDGHKIELSEDATG